MVRDLPETTYAVLGLLDMERASGYDLAAFADRALGYFWPISRTLVYRELGRLESLGWVESEPVPQDRLPDKRVWSSTEEGRGALTAWLAQPAVPGGADRNGFLVKFFFGDRMSPEAMRRLLDDYRETLEATRADLAALIEHLAGVPDGRMGRRSARHGLRTAEARLAWIDEVEAEMTGTSQLPPAEEADPHDDSAHHQATRVAQEARETA
jgi:DNA-binding PadR family transcriptional regulator